MLIPFPDEKYSVIYMDPPWSYKDKANDGNRGADHKYPTMSLEEIKSMPILDIAAPNCVIFMWTTSPFLEDAFSVLKAYRFKFKTVAFTWIKTNKNGTIFRGMGHYTRSNAEYCLLATRGRTLERLDKGISSVIISPRREHSRKPDEARERIVQMYGDVPRIELFAREAAPGWERWGLEAP